jgi:hypothetical protein
MSNDDDEPSEYQLRSGEYLSPSEATKLTQAAPTSIVVLGGSARSGKTSMVAGLYAMLQGGALGSWYFAGSHSLTGFEQRCHLATVGSGRINPDMERTKVDSHQFLHLKLWNVESGKSSNILFTDIPGETFDNAADSDVDCKELTILHRADNFVILIDGKKVFSKVMRQQAFAVVESLLAQCLENKMLTKSSAVQLVVSKWDLANKVGDDHLKFLDAKLEKLKKTFESRVGELTVHKIAVRHWSDGKVDTNSALLELLSKWLRIQPINPYEPVKVSGFATEFDKFQFAAGKALPK